MTGSTVTSIKVFATIVILTVLAIVNPYGPLAVPLLIIGLVVAYAFYKLMLKMFRNDSVWALLVERFDNREMAQKFDDFTEKRLYFRASADQSFQSYNLVSICTSQGGIDIRPSPITTYLKPIFIPDAQIEFIGGKRISLLKRSVYQIKDTTLQIAF